MLCISVKKKYLKNSRWPLIYLNLTYFHCQVEYRFHQNISLDVCSCVDYDFYNQFYVQGQLQGQNKELKVKSVKIPNLTLKTTLIFKFYLTNRFVMFVSM